MNYKFILLETLYKRDCCQLLDRQDEIGLDSGNSKVFYTSETSSSGGDSCFHLNRKANRITRKRRNKNQLRYQSACATCGACELSP